MVKTRFAVDSESSKMPVKNSTAKVEARQDVDSASMSDDKDNSDFSSKTPKVWSRELRNRFVISSEKRSIRFTNDVDRSSGGGRGMRSCRMSLASRQHHNQFTLSQSDDDVEDERIFASRNVAKRMKRLRLSKRRIHARPASSTAASGSVVVVSGAKRRREQSSTAGNTTVSSVSPSSRRHHLVSRGLRRRRRTMNGAILAPSEVKTPAVGRVPPEDDEEEEEEGAQVDNGIRRSTRQRKLKYENYSDSWIVGAQTLIGYPMYGNSYADKGGRQGSGTLKEEEVDDDDEEDDVDEEEEEEDEEEEKEGVVDETEDTEEEEEEVVVGSGKSVNASASKVGRGGGGGQGKVKVEADARGGGGGGGTSAQGGGAENNNNNNTNSGGEGFEDMYSRVKRARPRRVLYQMEGKSSRRNDGTRRGDTKPPVNTSTSEESSSDERVGARASVGVGARVRSVRYRNLAAERKYSLRKNLPTVDRFVPEVTESRSSRAMREVYRSSPVRRRQLRRRRPSSSSSSSDQTDERDRARFQKPKARSRCLSSVGQETHVNVECGGSKSGHHHHGVVTAGTTRSSNVGRLADVDPISLDTSIRFSHVGGLEEHVRCLQEMVVFPMLYSEIFAKFHVTPPKGVLFHGPPGTGKTLIARALANECSQGARKVSFFMRKGADCLSKWVGESERQLRLLFEQAYQSRPSIIFFDEIDGLAPVRSAKQDQIHASIVSTLLALMDGLDDRGEIVVIGATNRIDAIDPALRRPGRFDRELLFPLPANKERKEILRIHVSKWERPPPPPLLGKLAEMSVGFCGSDLRALCSEAVIHALKRRYPQIYKSSQKLLLNPDNVQVERIDFETARKGIVPSSYRSTPAVARKLPAFLQPLLARPYSELLAHLKSAFPSGYIKALKSLQVVKSPRLLIVGQKMQTTLLSAALLYSMEHCPVHVLDLAALFCQSSRSPEEACIQIFNEVRRTVPSILYLPGLGDWWETVGNTVQAVFTSLLCQMDPCLPVLLMATAHSRQLPSQLANVFSVYRDEVYVVSASTDKERESFFRPLIVERSLRPPRPMPSRAPLEELPIAPPPSPPKLTDAQLKSVYGKEENTLRELRIFLRQICAKLARNRQFFMFSKPVDVNEVPDYLAIIKEPMDLEKMMTKIDLHKYMCAQDFLNDVDLLVSNALEYNPDREPADKLIRHRACFLRDTAYALIEAEMDSDFEDQCRSIRNARAGRAASPGRFVPDFLWTATTQPSAIERQNHLQTFSGLDTVVNGPSLQSSSSSAVCNNLDVGGSSGRQATMTGHPVSRGVSSAGSTNANAGGVATGPHHRSVRKRRRASLWQRGLIRPPKAISHHNRSATQNASAAPGYDPKQEKSNKTEPSSCSSMSNSTAAGGTNKRPAAGASPVGSTAGNSPQLAMSTRSSGSAAAAAYVCNSTDGGAHHQGSNQSATDTAGGGTTLVHSTPVKRRRRDDSAASKLTSSPIASAGEQHQPVVNGVMGDGDFEDGTFQHKHRLNLRYAPSSSTAEIRTTPVSNAAIVDSKSGVVAISNSRCEETSPAAVVAKEEKVEEDEDDDFDFSLMLMEDEATMMDSDDDAGRRDPTGVGDGRNLDGCEAGATPSAADRSMELDYSFNVSVDSVANAPTASVVSARTPTRSSSATTGKGNSCCNPLNTATTTITSSSGGACCGKKAHALTVVGVNRQALNRVLQEAVRATDSGICASFELILDLYAQLRNVINRHMKSHVRTKLPQELEAEIKRFSSQRHSLEPAHRHSSAAPASANSVVMMTSAPCGGSGMESTGPASPDPSSANSCSSPSSGLLAQHSHNTRHRAV